MSVPPSQEAAAAFLQGLTGNLPIETHISAVFVGAGTAWKLKKAVRLPFLDFTTLEARHRFLRREMELNKAAAPDIYLGVVAIDRAPDGSLVLRTEAESCTPQDWVLCMAPIKSGNLLDAIAERGALTAMLQDALGDCVADYHQARPPIVDWDGPGALRRVADCCAVSAVAAGLPADATQQWQDGMSATLGHAAQWLRERAAAGFVRRCHGDLHLGNLCLWHGRVVPFDALEFDEELATTDVAYDLAFLLMDLDLRGERPAANRVLNRYIARTGDTGLCRGLPAFISLRAMAMAQVRAASGQMEPASSHLRAALAYLQPEPPTVLAVGGRPGSGKSTLARCLAPRIGRAPGAVVLRSEEIRKRIFSALPERQLPPYAYNEQANCRVNQELAVAVQEVAAGGQAVIADATFVDPGLRSAVAAASEAAGVPFAGFWLTAPRAVLEDRVSQRQGDASDATIAVLRNALAKDLSEIAWYRVDAADGARAAEAIVAGLPTTPEAPDHPQ